MQRHVFPVFLAIASIGLGGASCGNKSAADPDNGDSKAVVAALDKATLAEESKGPKKDIDGVDLAKLDGSERKLYDKLIDSLVSPCGKAESLRKSATISKDCKRSVFAARYVAMLVRDGATEEQAREFYGKRYVDNNPVEIAVGPDVPHVGPVDAPVVIVEFMDYGCPACKAAKPAIEQALKMFPSQVVLYYKNYPLVHVHQNSKMAAQAVVAATKQGKFHDMHDLLFEKQGAQEKDQLFEYAKQLGLDMDTFKADFEAAAPAVEADMAQGDQLKLKGTPSFFVNGRRYEDLLDPRYFESWIEEELVVNR